MLCAVAIQNLIASSAFLETRIPLSLELERSLCGEQSKSDAVSRRRCDRQPDVVQAAAAASTSLLIHLAAPAYFKYRTRTELHIVFKIKIGCLKLLISLSLLRDTVTELLWTEKILFASTLGLQH